MGCKPTFAGFSCIQGTYCSVYAVCYKHLIRGIGLTSNLYSGKKQQFDYLTKSTWLGGIPAPESLRYDQLS
jgi:hypothetical protein